MRVIPVTCHIARQTFQTVKRLSKYTPPPLLRQPLCHTPLLLPRVVFSSATHNWLACQGEGFHTVHRLTAKLEQGGKEGLLGGARSSLPSAPIPSRIFNNKCISLSNLPHSAQHTCVFAALLMAPAICRGSGKGAWHAAR